jgi:hypothetical protein
MSDMSELHWDWDGDPDPEQQAKIDAFYADLFYEPELTPPEHHEEQP